MNRSAPNRKCVVLYLISFALGAVTAPGWTKTEAAKRTGGVAAVGSASVAARDRRAKEAYQRRNAEITPWAEDSAPANPCNAALLYYQALLFRPEPNEAMRYKIRPGTEPTRQIRAYLGHCLPVIEMVETASRIPACRWGVWPKGGPSWAPLRDQLGDITNILLVDAGTLAADGHYRVALERCLTVRRLARHLSEDPKLHIYGPGPDKLALHTVRDVLGVMPPDADILTWFRGQLAVVRGPGLFYAEKLRGRVRSELDIMRKNPSFLGYCKDSAVSEAGGEQAKENVRNLTDEQFLLRASEGLARFTDSISRILDSDATYERKLAQMRGLFGETMEEDGTDPVVKGVMSLSGMNMKGEIDRGYPFLVAHTAHINGIKAAVEVYLVVAKTGSLPEKLPSHLPKDPFTGQDFIYEITDEGFALRCQGKEFTWRTALEFKVRN